MAIRTYNPILYLKSISVSRHLGRNYVPLQDYDVRILSAASMPPKLNNVKRDELLLKAKKCLKT